MSEHQVDQTQVATQGFKSKAQGNLSLTLEALLPQYRKMLRIFYVRHDPGCTPIAANRWLHRELISRFGTQPVLGDARRIARRLKAARRGVLATLDKTGGQQ